MDNVLLIPLLIIAILLMNFLIGLRVKLNQPRDSVAYIVQIDLSAKVEQWSRDSAIAVCDGGERVYLVQGSTKRQARQLITQLYGGKSAHYRMLAVLLYLAIRDDLLEIRQIVIDRDYPGSQAEATIKNLLLHLLRRDRPHITAGFIRFENVTGSRADMLARGVFQRKTQPDREIRFEEIAVLLRK
jgi:hypothetical protein